MKVEKNINGGGFFDWFTRKKLRLKESGIIILKREKSL